MTFGHFKGAARLAVDVPNECLRELIKLARACEPDLIAVKAGDSYDGCSGVALSLKDDPSARELRNVICALSKDEQAVLVALVWIGQGDFGPDEFDHALTQAFDRQGVSVSDFLLGCPTLAQALERGVLACEERASGARVSQSAGIRRLLH